METYDNKFVEIEKCWINLNESNERNIQVKVENILLFLSEELKITMERETLNSKEKLKMNMISLNILMINFDILEFHNSGKILWMSGK